jgi:hypothetical protein
MILPRFNEARGETASMQLIPPFHFTGVTMRVFPLRANRYLLQRFIDQQLNIIPPEAGQFRVFLPYIYLIIVNYGRMSVEAANLGWISQNEVAFSVPLIWTRQAGGKLVQDFAYVSPFIYVDNPLSMTTGREVYGWPKMMAGFDPQLSSWMANPTNRIQQAAMSVDMVREAYSGAHATRCTLMEVDSAPIPTFAQVPFDVRNPLMPWNAMRKAIYTSSALLGDSVEIFRGVLDEFVQGQAREGIGGQIERAMKSPASLGVLNTVNLKQFRDAQDPELFCYQAVTNTPMTIKSFRRGGMLGDLRTLAGDVTGGYRIRIHNYDTQPIIGSLGLEVSSTAEIEGTNVSNLLPVFPFWLELDLEYPLASIVAWRHKGSRGWHHDDKVTPTAVGERFNTSRGAGGQEIAGPFQFPDATIRVLPLLADPALLDKFIDAYLNSTLTPNSEAGTPAASTSVFKAWGRYVYLIVLDDDGSFSESNNVGDLATRQVRLFIPVKWYQRTGETERLVSTALVPVYSYSNSATAAISISSVIGIPTMTAELRSPPSTWLARRGPSPSASDEYMVLRGDVLPVLNLGQQATVRTIIECDNREPLVDEDLHGWRRLADRWAPPLKREHARKRDVGPNQLRDAKTLALELLANNAAFTMLTLKQFRDAADPTQACYQALVAVPLEIQQLSELEEIETPLHVRIHEYPSQAIVSTLGLVVKDWQQGGGSRIAVIEPCRPFWLRGRLRQDHGTNIHVWPTPSGEAGWTEAPPLETLLTRGPRLGPNLVDEIEDGTPQYLCGQVTRWLEQADSVPLSAARACAVVEAVEPQVVIESVLSNEWEAWFDPRWRRGQNFIDEHLRRATANSYPSEITKKTAETLRGIRDRLLASADDHKLGIAPNRHRVVDEELESYSRLARLLADVQACEEQLQAVEVLSGPIQAKPEEARKQAALERRKHADQELLLHLHKMRHDDEPQNDAGLSEEPLGPGLDEALEHVFEVLEDVFESDDLDHDMIAAMDDDERKMIVATVRETLEHIHTAIVLKLAKSWQKPDMCIRRQTVLHHSVDAYFPRQESFDEQWYKGPCAEAVDPLSDEIDAIGEMSGSAAADSSSPAG